MKRINFEDAFVQCECIGLGIGLYVVYHRAYPTPLAFAWGIGYTTENGRRFDTYGRHTPDPYQRNGLQRLINKKIFEWYDVITTCSATPKGSKFLKREGYKYDKKIRLWYKEKKHGRQ